jgi:FkbM family methyltransferase
MDIDFIIAGELIKNFFPPDFGVMDIGCHEGAFTRHIIGNRDASCAIMVDPLPDKIAQVKKQFSGARIFQCAVSDEERDADFFVTTDFPKCSALYDREAYDQVPALNKRDKISVKMRRLDSILDEIEFDKIPIAGWYLKLDTEGYEMEAFKSLGRFKENPKILAGHFEYGGTWKERNLKINDMLGIFHNLGFMTLKCFQSQNSYNLASIETIDDDYQFENIYFVRKNLIESFNL